jgi:hypothetical protein
MARTNGVTAEQVIQALKDKQGFVAAAADQLGYSARRIYQLINEKPTIKEALDHIREKRTDFVETKMLEKIQSGDTTMIIFYLKTQAKDRGYIERQEIAGDSDSPLVVKLVKGVDLKKAIS